jgi:hypothetical protein
MMPTLSTITTAALAIAGAIFAFIAIHFFQSLISANVRRWASETGHDAYLLKLWDALPEWGHKLLAGWPFLRQLWWLWLCFGLSSGLGGALWLLSMPQASVSTSSTEDIAKAVAPIQAELDRTKQALVAAQQAGHLPMASPSVVLSQHEEPQQELSAEDIATKLSIWESVGTTNLSSLVGAYNSLDLALSRWSILINSDTGKRQLYQDIINATAAFTKASHDLDTLRSEYPQYHDIFNDLIQPHTADLTKVSADFSNAVISAMDEAPSDLEVRLRSFAGALRMEMNIMVEWLETLRKMAGEKRKELSASK